jgi:hypothetical protein
VDPRTAAALDEVPHARDWARGFTALGWGSHNSFARRSAPAIVHSAVSGIAVAVHPSSDDILVDLLRRTIEMFQTWVGRESTPVDATTWQRLGALTRPS